MKSNCFLKKAVKTALFSALISCSAFFSIPIFTVPITLQSFAVFLSLFVLGPLWGTVSVFVYVVLGIVGLPVFSGGCGGIGHIFDIGGGFIIGFFLLTLSYSLFATILGRSLMAKIISSVIGQLVLYISGLVWYVLMFDWDITYGIYAFVFPFMILDIGKIILALIISEKIKKHLKRIE